jgi:hypothetical protein
MEIDYEKLTCYIKRLETTVARRYSDFITLHEILSKRYTFRMLVDIPPKKKLGSK